MRATLMEVLDPARGEAMYTIEWLVDRVRQHLDARCGYLKPLEGGSRLADLDVLLRDDLVRLGGGSAADA